MISEASPDLGGGVKNASSSSSSYAFTSLISIYSVNVKLKLYYCIIVGRSHRTEQSSCLSETDIT